jgi:branched-chain amino acid transport system permease protein
MTGNHIVLYGVGAYTSGMLAKNFGIPVFLAIPIGGFFAGIAGGLLVHRLGAVDPKLFNLVNMLYLLIWVVVGGTNTFWGPIIGVTVLHTLFELSRPLIEIRPMFFGLAMVLVLIFLPGGIEGVISKIMRRMQGRQAVSTAET